MNCPTCSTSARWPEYIHVDGNRIKRIREDQDRSQGAVAAETRVTASYLSRIENHLNDRVSPEVAYRLCRALRVGLEEIIE